jgi:hypothetical protein
MGCPGYRSYRRTCPHCKERIYINLYLELAWDTLRKVLSLSKKKHPEATLNTRNKSEGKQ